MTNAKLKNFATSFAFAMMMMTSGDPPEAVGA